MDANNIPWSTLDEHLTRLGKTQAWLARELNTGTNVIANWRSRGGAPLARAAELSKVLGCSTDALLRATTPLRGMKRKQQAATPETDPRGIEASLVQICRSLRTEEQAELLRFAQFLLHKEDDRRPVTSYNSPT